MIDIYGKTDTGLTRDHNEDSIGWNDEKNLVVLADGMGGHNAGEVASEMAVSTVLEQLGSAVNANPQQEIKEAIAMANRAIHLHAKESLVCAGMGTTIVVALFHDNQLTFAHVGDSRLYRMRDHRLQQLTLDHSLVQELVDEGFMNEQEAHDSVSKNVITRALGLEPIVKSDIQQQDICEGDRYLICSDGLSDMLETRDIEQLVEEKLSPEQLVDKLIEQANSSGGDDNISAIVVDIK